MIGLIDLLAAPYRALDGTARWIVGRTVPSPSGLGPYCEFEDGGVPCDNWPDAKGVTTTGEPIEVCAEHDWVLAR